MTKSSEIKEKGAWWSENWEKLLFRLLGLALFGFSFHSLLIQREATVFVSAALLGIFCFLYANFTKFKRFKGFGIEAELWEDKKQEAAKLVDQLKAIVEIYSREVLLARAKGNRFSDENGQRARWKETWALYDRIVGAHQLLGQEIDFASLKRELDTYFLFDAMMPTYEAVAGLLREAHQAASQVIGQEFPQPISDAEGYNTRLKQLRSCKYDMFEPFPLVEQRRLASELERWLNHEISSLESNFGVRGAVDPDLIQKISELQSIERLNQIPVTSALIDQVGRDMEVPKFLQLG